MYKKIIETDTLIVVLNFDDRTLPKPKNFSTEKDVRVYDIIQDGKVIKFDEYFHLVKVPDVISERATNNVLLNNTIKAIVEMYKRKWNVGHVLSTEELENIFKDIFMNTYDSVPMETREFIVRKNEIIFDWAKATLVPVGQIENVEKIELSMSKDSKACPYCLVFPECKGCLMALAGNCCSDSASSYNVLRSLVLEQYGSMYIVNTITPWYMELRLLVDEYNTRNGFTDVKFVEDAIKKIKKDPLTFSF